MITKGKATTGRGLAAHLLKAENERVELWGISGTVARTVNAAVDNWRAFALGTTCDKPLYHAQLNPSPDDRPLSREEWEKAIAIFEKEMGLEGYPRAVVFHEKKGREHIHLVYSRFNPELEQEKLKAWSDSWNYPKHERASREIERELGLRKTKGVFEEREGPRPERTPSHDAMQQGERTQRDPKEIKAEVSALYAARAGNGRAFVGALEAKGYTLARGDKRGFVILDQAGGVHSLTRAASAKAGDLGKTLHEYCLDALPSVEQAREISKTRQPISPTAALEKAKAEITEPAPPPPKTREQKKAEWEEAERQRFERDRSKPLDETASIIRACYTSAASGQSFTEALQEHDITLARVSADEAAQSHRKAAFAQEIGNYAKEWREGELVAVDGKGRAYRLDASTTDQRRPEIEAFLAPIDRDPLLTLAEAREAMKAVAHVRWIEQKQAAREATGTEQKIKAAFDATFEREEFLERLAEAGITLAKTDAADLYALGREEDERQRRALENDEERHPRRIPAEGELVAVGKFGDVHRLNAQKLDLHTIEERLGTDGSTPPTVQEAREAWKESREIDRAPAPEARAIEPEQHGSPAPQIDTRSDGSLKSAEATLSRGVDALGGAVADVLEAASDALENAVLGILDPTPPPPPPSREQTAAREAAKEEAEARAADLKRYLTDQDYRRQLWRQEMEAQEEQRKQSDKAKEQDNSRGRERSHF